MILGACTLHLHLPGCASLKEKRGRLKPLLARLRREFNVSVAEVDLNDVWQSAAVGLAVVSNDPGHAQAELEHIAAWVEKHWIDVQLLDARFEIR